jgi:hypothetical protein
MADVDIGTETYQAFIELDDADTYLAGDVARATGWALLNPDAKGRALVSATRMLLALPFCEAAPDPVLQDVTAMLAADLAAKPRLFADASGNSNVKSAKAGSASVEFFSPVDGGPPLPRALWNRLLAAGLVCLGSDTSGLDGALVSGISGGCRPLGGRLPWDWPLAAQDYD